MHYFYYVIFLFAVCYINLTNSANILGLFAYPGKSHFIVLKSIMLELAKRGHNVTVVSNFKIDEKIDNYNELTIDEPFDYWAAVKDHLNKKHLFDMKDLSVIEIFNMMNIIGLTTTDHFLKNPHIQNIIHKPTTQYDLIIVEQFYQDALLMMGHLYKVPILAISTSSFENHMSNMMGVIVPWSHSPQDFLSYSDHMNFWQRLHNFYCSLYSEYNRKYIYFPQQETLIQKYFPHSSEILPSISDLEKNISVLLVNNFIPLDMSRPMVMGLIPIGGVHISQPKKLIWDIQRFCDDATHGVIYFSLGTNLKSSDLPTDTIAIMLKVFSKLKERVLWKWEDENLPNLPQNVKIKKWVSQTDVLAHPHVKYFITHGGLLSLQEALYRNVPVLGIPIFGDQHINMKKVEDLGIGVRLDFTNITEISLTWALEKLIQDSSYSNQMRQIAKIFRDRPMGAMETAIYWIDYVIRYNGALHIKTAAIDLSWMSLYLIDILLFLTFVITIIILGIFLFIKILLILRNNQKPNSNKRYNKLLAKEI